MLKSSFTSPRVKADINSILLKQSHNSDALQVNFSSREIVLQSILTPKVLLSEADDDAALPSLITDLFVLIWFTTEALLFAEA